jgi:hypothetical protein
MTSYEYNNLVYESTSSLAYINNTNCLHPKSTMLKQKVEAQYKTQNLACICILEMLLYVSTGLGIRHGYGTRTAPTTIIHAW